MLKGAREASSSVGIVTYYRPEKGYGFLWSEQDDTNCLFRIKDYKGEIEPERGDMVSFYTTSSDRGVQAKEIHLEERGKLRDPAVVGITCWTGPGRAGDYGLVLHKGKGGDGTFIHKTYLVDGSSDVVSNILYKMDVAKVPKGYIGLNVRQVPTNQDTLIEKLANDPFEAPHVRLKALEILSIKEGRYEEFAAKVKQVAKCQPMSQPEEIDVELPYGIRFKQKGEPSENTLRLTKIIIIGGLGLLVAGGTIAIILSSISSSGES